MKCSLCKQVHQSLILFVNQVHHFQLLFVCLTRWSSIICCSFLFNSISSFLSSFSSWNFSFRYSTASELLFLYLLDFSSPKSAFLFCVLLRRSMACSLTSSALVFSLLFFLLTALVFSFLSRSAALSFSAISSSAASSWVFWQSLPDALSSSLIFYLYLVCSRVNLSLTDLFDTVNFWLLGLFRLTAIRPQISLRSLLRLGYLNGSNTSTSP